MFADLTSFLFSLVKRESSKLAKNKPTTRSGFEFENFVANSLLEHFIKSRYGEKVYPPRCELAYPTFSGIKHQFDNIVEFAKTFFVIECKRRKASAKDQILAFNAKILDYALGFVAHNLAFQIKGVFLSTAKISEGARSYALGFGMVPLDADCPWLDYMASKARKDCILQRQLDDLKVKLSFTLPALLDMPVSKRDPQHLLILYQQVHQMWRSRGYE